MPVKKLVTVPIKLTRKDLRIAQIGKIRQVTVPCTDEIQNFMDVFSENPENVPHHLLEIALNCIDHAKKEEKPEIILKRSLSKLVNKKDR